MRKIHVSAVRSRSRSCLRSSHPTLRRFEKEAKAAAALDHPNILDVHDVGTHGDTPYVVTELLKGETLRERMAESRLIVDKAIEYGVQVARGLAAAHDEDIVHRDLKPENLFVTKDGLVKILDFGLAKMVRGKHTKKDAETASIASATDAGKVMGTAGYMSPEQRAWLPAPEICRPVFGGSNSADHYTGDMQTTNAPFRQAEDLPPREEIYRALVRPDTSYEEVFYLGVRTTGIFCRPTCPGKNPKRENVEFFASTREAVTAGYRPCRPMRPRGAAPEWLEGLMREIEADPSRRWGRR